MNESEKNIETCLPESILAEVASVPTDPQFVSLVNESLDPLKQQAFQQAGSDAYNEVVASHQPYTFTSSVRQMKSNLILLLRRFWRFPFGAGTLRSLSDMWAHYITRLQGNETYGIPSRLDQLSDLPSAPLLVADRKISGVPEAEDGMSFVRVLMDSALGITELTDDNIGWYLTKAFPFSVLSSLQTLTLCFTGRLAYGRISGSSSLKVLNIPYATDLYRYSSNPAAIANMSVLEEINGERVTYVYGEPSDYGAIHNCPNLKKLKLGKVTTFYRAWRNDNSPMANLIHLEFGQDTAISLDLSYWNPTNVLADQDLLQQFLSNFRSFIVLRLANRKTTTALTLTLSAAVYNAVTGANSGWASQHTLADLGITDNDLTDLETELGITSATIYATWLDTYTGANGIHWDINKAN